VAQTAREVWTQIGLEFNELRQSNRAKAYRRKQQRIHENFGILSEIISAKDLLDEARKCEEFMTGDEGSKGGSALDQLASFLNGKPESRASK
jgi:hypothetical protein